ncbi:MAG: NAD-dependent epimerase/dehydratase family protein [Synergistaceae bacterium]|nr:NAD-dependent epimerase/dehydratase family protein [Synergistaceae bacterium]
MKVLIMGGTGAMGNYLVDIFAKMGAEVHVTTRREKISSQNVKYIRGNAKDLDFIRPLIESGNYDAVIDFMIYSTYEFIARYKFFTDFAGHYIFLSSSRVYADSDSPITENSPRLLDVSKDSKYLLTDEYALTKARQENILLNGRAGNFTIIRPYITYSNERLQLGVYEKERWLYRALHGREIVFSRDIASRFTTMTWGHDVAGAIADLAGNNNAFGEVFHITGDDSMKWEDIAELYIKILTGLTGHEAKIIYVDKAFDNTAQLNYDRLYNRIFDNGKIKSLVKNFKPLSICEGLKKCLTEFVRDNHAFNGVDWSWEARVDKVCGGHAKINEFDSFRAGRNYFLERYCPALLYLSRLPKRVIRRLRKK